MLSTWTWTHTSKLNKRTWMLAKQASNSLCLQPMVGQQLSLRKKQHYILRLQKTTQQMTDNSVWKSKRSVQKQNMYIYFLRFKFLFLLKLFYLAKLSWQPWASVQIGHHCAVSTGVHLSCFSAAAEKPRTTLFIIQPTLMCNSCPVLLLTSHSEVTSLCTSTTALVFQHGSRTAAQQSAARQITKRPRSEPSWMGARILPSQPRQLGAACNKWETMRTSTPPTLCMWMSNRNWNWMVS